LHSRALCASPLGSPPPVFSGLRINASRHAATFAASLKRNRLLVSAFRSPRTAGPFSPPIPGSMFPACYFATLANRFHRPFGLQLHPEARFASTPRGFLAENPLPLPRSTPRAAPPASTPLWDFYLPKDQSVPLVGCPAACLPTPPDFRSLPAARNYLISN